MRIWFFLPAAPAVVATPAAKSPSAATAAIVTVRRRLLIWILPCSRAARLAAAWMYDGVFAIAIAAMLPPMWPPANRTLVHGRPRPRDAPPRRLAAPAVTAAGSKG